MANTTRSTSNDTSALQVRKRGRYGWIRDLPDARDYMYAAPAATFAAGLPLKVDLRPQCPAVYDQGQLGSCTANGIGAGIEFDQIKQKALPFVPSRLFIYYNERVIENDVPYDAGAQIRDGMHAVAKLGAPPEPMWPYDIAKFADKPSAAVYKEAKKDLVTVYSRVPQLLSQMQGCLAQGFPFVFGFTVYDSFESQQVATTGVVPLPDTSRERVLGGHCVLAVGYDSSTHTFIIRNSWGTGWGQAGYCTMPFEYLTSPQLASDFWTIRSVATGSAS